MFFFVGVLCVLCVFVVKSRSLPMSELQAMSVPVRIQAGSCLEPLRPLLGYTPKTIPMWGNVGVYMTTPVVTAIIHPPTSTMTRQKRCQQM